MIFTPDEWPLPLRRGTFFVDVLLDSGCRVASVDLDLGAAIYTANEMWSSSSVVAISIIHLGTGVAVEHPSANVIAAHIVERGGIEYHARDERAIMRELA